jgi:hypothetical protein
MVSVCLVLAQVRPILLLYVMVCVDVHFIYFFFSPIKKYLHLFYYLIKVVYDLYLQILYWQKDVR